MESFKDSCFFFKSLLPFFNPELDASSTPFLILFYQERGQVQRMLPEEQNNQTEALKHLASPAHVSVVWSLLFSLGGKMRTSGTNLADDSGQCGGLFDYVLLESECV